MLNYLLQHCTSELLTYVFGNTNIESEISTNIIHIENCINKKCNLVDVMKVLYVFEKYGGNLYYHNEPSEFPVIIREIGDVELTKITLFWVNNECNGVVPIFEKGDIIVPEVLPIFIVTQQPKGWCIEKLIKGEYHIMKNEFYPTEEIAKARAKEQNQNIVY